MNSFNLDDYEPVEVRIKKFYKDYPSGRVITELVSNVDGTVMFKAYLYRNFEDENPWTTGYAEETKGDGYVNKTSHVENCETSAIGRALANANYSGDKRPSKEEMKKVQKTETSEISSSSDSECDHEPVEVVAQTGQHVGKKYRKCVKCKKFLSWVTAPQA